MSSPEARVIFPARGGFTIEPQERQAVIRVIDANYNRAREAVRVLEDYARFLLDDAALAARFKELRHRVREAINSAGIDDATLLSARDTEADVGRADRSPTEEKDRKELRDITASGFKRLQESLRTIAEYCKLLDAASAAAIESVRYESYTLEKILLQSRSSRDSLDSMRLYVLVSQDIAKRPTLEVVRAALEGGADTIQLREKTLSDTELLALARDARALTAEHDAILIINDRPDIAALSNADGVHLGQDDLPVREARKILGAEKIVGVSTHSIEQARAAEGAGADYIAVGPVFQTSTKEIASPVGVELVRQVVAEIRTPFVVIGGITLGNIGEVIAAGAQRVAVCSAIIAADDITAQAKKFREACTQTVPGTTE